jgi:2-haloalkanoic acid dehalogenase type II
MNRIRAITFDAFGTIVDTGRDALLGISSRIVRDHLPDVGPEAFLERWDVHFFGIDHNPFLTLAEATRVSLARAFAEYRLETDPEPYVERLQEEWRRAKAYPEVPAVLEALDGVPRAVVSNADDAMLREILARNGLEFDAIITSKSCRTYKPGPEIFKAAMRELGTPPSEILHVGDSLEADVAGARKVGIATAWVNRGREAIRPDGPRPDLEIEDLTGVLPLFHRRPPARESE